MSPAARLRELAMRIDRHVDASKATSLQLMPRTLPNVETTMEVSLSHFLDIARDLERVADMLGIKSDQTVG